MHRIFSGNGWLSGGHADESARLEQRTGSSPELASRSPEARRYRERTTVERVNGRLKEEFGGRHVRVRGPGKVMCHLMFGILALTVEQLMRLIL